MPEVTHLNEATLRSLLKGEIGARYRYNPYSFDMPDPDMLDVLAHWANLAAKGAGALGGIGYSMHRLASTDGVTQIYLLMEYARLRLLALGQPVPKLATLGKIAVVGSVVLFIWGSWENLAMNAASAVVDDYLAHEPDYALADDVFPLSPEVAKASVAPGRRIAGV